MPTLELDEGFESGSLAAYGSAGSATIDATAALEGSLGLHTTGAGAQNISYSPSAGKTLHVGRFTFKVPTGGLPTGAIAVLIQVRTASAKNFQIRVSQTGVLSAIITGGTAQNGPTVTEGTEYVIDLKADCSGTTFTLDWQVNGTAQTQATLSGTTASTISTSSGEKLANTTAGVTAFTCYFDSWAISRTAADYPIGSPGGATTNITITVSSGSTLVLTKKVQLVKSVSSGSTISAPVKAVAKALTFSAGSTASLAKRVGKVLPSISTGSTLSLAASKVFMVAITLSSASGLSLSKRVGKVVPVSSGSSNLIGKAIARTLAFTSGNTPTVTKQATKTVSVSSGSTVSLPKQIGKILASTAHSLVTLDVFGGAPITYVVDITVSSASDIVTSAQHFVRHAAVLFSTEGSSTSITKRVGKVITRTTSSVLSILRGLIYTTPDPENNIFIETSDNRIGTVEGTNTITITEG